MITISTSTAITFAFGFLLQCNLLPTAFGSRFLHITDILVLFAMLALPVLTLRRLQVALVITYVFVLGLLFLLSAVLAVDRGHGEFYTTAFSFFYSVTALFFIPLLDEEKGKTAFCVGFLAGMITSLVLLILDFNGVGFLKSIGLAFNYNSAEALFNAAHGHVTSALLRLAKAGGLWGQGNEAAPVFATAAAAAGYLSVHHRRPALYLVFLGIFLLSFSFTLNRSTFPPVVLVGLLVYLSKSSKKDDTYKTLAIILAGAVALVGLSLIGFDDSLTNALQHRFISDEGAGENLSTRFESAFVGLSIALQYPFGIGTTTRMALMSTMSVVTTPHNGFIALAFSCGMGWAIAQAMACLYVLISMRKDILIFYATIILSACYFFEELCFNPVFMMLSGLIMAAASRDIARKLTPQTRRSTVKYEFGKRLGVKKIELGRA